jgi:hypothetical protein
MGRSTPLHSPWWQPCISAFFITDLAYGASSSRLLASPEALLMAFTRFVR